MVDLFDIEDGGRYEWTLASVHATGTLKLVGAALEVTASRIVIGNGEIGRIEVPPGLVTEVREVTE